MGIKMNKQILTVYIASPFSSTNKAVERFRYNEITRIAAKLYYKYPHAFILPITQSYQLKKHEPRLGGSFARWRDVDLKFISVSDEVWVIMLDGWKDSIGVMAEIEYANQNGKTVRYLNPNTMRFKKQRGKTNAFVNTQNPEDTVWINENIDPILESKLRNKYGIYG